MRVYSIKVNGKKYKVEVMGISEVEPVKVETVKASAPAASTTSKPAEVAAPVASGSGTPVVSPMQGTILDVKVKVGQTVKVGDTVAILEAMKLENEIKSQVAGKVLEIKVSKGQNVNSKEVLILVG